MEKLVGVESLYFSRSELIRTAVGRKLKREILLAKEATPIPEPEPEEPEENKLKRLVRESLETTQNNEKLQKV